MRNLGHELSASRPKRTQEAARFTSLTARVRKLHILKKAVGCRRMVRIQAAGLTPAVLHGAAVAGVAEHVLRPVRTLAGVMAGVKPGASLTIGILLQPNAKYDPIFKATTEVLYLYAGWIWEARGSLHQLQTAWRHMRSRMGKSESWSKVRGPLAAA